MQIQAAIFDLDGTLADTIDAIRGSVNDTMRHYGYPERSYDEVRLAIGTGAKNLIRGTLPQALAQDEETVARVFATYQNNYDQNHLATDHCYDGIPALIAALHAAGVRLAVLSNKQDRHVQGLVKQLFPAGEFSVAMGQTELPRKPDPTVPLLIARQLGVAPEHCAFIGDSEVDIRTAKNAGMPSFGCAWGYRERELLDAQGADAIADSPAQLHDILFHYIIKK